MKKTALASMQRQNGFAAPADDEKTPAALQGILWRCKALCRAPSMQSAAKASFLSRCRILWRAPGSL